jgi:hypothetical protein
MVKYSAVIEQVPTTLDLGRMTAGVLDRGARRRQDGSPTAIDEGGIVG